MLYACHDAQLTVSKVKKTISLRFALIQSGNIASFLSTNISTDENIHHINRTMNSPQMRMKCRNSYQHLYVRLLILIAIITSHFAVG